MPIKINGVVTPDSEIMDSLMALPSDFLNLGWVLNGDIIHKRLIEVCEQYKQGVELLEQGTADEAKKIFLGNTEFLKNSNYIHSDTESKFPKIVIPSLSYINDYHIGKCCYKLNEFEEAEMYFNNYLELNSSNSYHEEFTKNVYSDLFNIHKNKPLILIEQINTRLAKYLLNNDQTNILNTYLGLSVIYELMGDKNKHEDSMVALALFTQGLNIENAEIVMQHEVGFSKKLIGTYNLFDCIALIIRDPETHKTALAHIDTKTPPKSIGKILRQMGSSYLEVYLVGGKDSKHVNFEKSAYNLDKIVNVLKKYPNINIIAADILDKPHPSAFVFNPENGELIHGRPNINAELDKIFYRDGISFSRKGTDQYSLHMALKFDNYLPYKIDSVHHELIKYGHLNEDKSDSHRNVRSFKQLQKEIENAEIFIRCQLTKDITLSEKDIVEIIFLKPLYLGQNSSTANLYIASKIKDQMLGIKTSKYQLSSNNDDIFLYLNNEDKVEILKEAFDLDDSKTILLFREKSPKIFKKLEKAVQSNSSIIKDYLLDSAKNLYSYCITSHLFLYAQSLNNNLYKKFFNSPSSNEIEALNNPLTFDNLENNSIYIGMTQLENLSPKEHASDVIKRRESDIYQLV